VRKRETKKVPEEERMKQRCVDSSQNLSSTTSPSLLLSAFSDFFLLCKEVFKINFQVSFLLTFFKQISHQDFSPITKNVTFF
jgi:hypothetical protein